jgi:omega-hydroxy-beta-dihydromenaquinone-9 sulfotransferase
VASVSRKNISLANNFLYGIRFGTWIRILIENRFSVSVRYWHRALAVTLASLGNSLSHRIEKRRFSAKVRGCASGPPPLFILGHWRNGTTHLQYLLSRDRDSFAFANTFQVFNPGAFLLTEKRFAPWMDRFLPKTRPMDNMSLGAASPAEDEFAMALMTGRSPYIGVSFPRHRERYSRYLGFASATPREVGEWKAAFLEFTAKLAYLHPNRRLILKSPAHTARIPLLLELFPEAKFVHIQRDPYAVFQSSRHIIDTLFPYMFLQKPDLREVDEDILQRYAEVNDSLLRDRSSIPEGNYHEMRYEDLEADPKGELMRLYGRLGLPGWGAALPGYETYLAALQTYRKNRFPVLDAETRALVRSRWLRFFEAFDYPA